MSDNAVNPRFGPYVETTRFDYTKQLAFAGKLATEEPNLQGVNAATTFYLRFADRPAYTVVDGMSTDDNNKITHTFYALVPKKKN